MTDIAAGGSVGEPAGEPASPQSDNHEQEVRALLADGLTAHQAGDLGLAESKYRAALKLSPQDSEGLHLLGIIASQNGAHDPAITLIGHAIANHPDYPAVPCHYHINLANALHGAARLDDAVVALHRALSADPSSVEGHFNLGNVLCDLGRYEEAEGEYRFAIQLEPGYGKAHARLGWVLEQQGRPREAIEAIRTASEINPEDPTLRLGLGRALAAEGRLEEALPMLEDLSPGDDAQSWATLGLCYADQQRWEDARESFAQALKSAPRDARAHAGLGEALYRLGEGEKALTHLLRACELNPEDMRALALTGMIYLDQGDLAQAVGRLERAEAGAPRDHQAHAALVRARFIQSLSAEDDWRSECAAWVKKFGSELPMPSGGPDRLDPHRTLRVGIITGQRPGETALRALVSFLGHRRRDQIETRCYTDLEPGQPLRPALLKLADEWIDCRTLSDGDLSAAIHADRVDILIDLSGCNRGNRLRTLSRRPAPVQIAWPSGYGPSVFPFFDYALADAASDDGSGVPDSGTLPLDGGLLAFVAPDVPPEPGPLPLASGTQPQFAAIGELVQFSEETIALFSRVLIELPESRLRLIVRDELHHETGRRLRRRFADYGVADRRLELVSLYQGHDEPQRDLAPLLDDADLAFDPFPKSNGFESYLALMAGLPVISLTGPLPQSKVTAGLLRVAGLESLRSGSIQEFVQNVTTLVDNPQPLAALRASLPAKVAGSPIADGAAFARGMEQALRVAWTRHCEAEKPIAAAS